MAGTRNLNQLIFQTSLDSPDENKKVDMWSKLELTPTSLTVLDQQTSRLPMDIDKMSGRLLVMGESRLILHDTAHFQFQSHELPDGPVASTDLLARQRIADLHWFPHDNGMVTMAMVNGSIKAWDMETLQIIDLYTSKDPMKIQCHQVCPQSGSATMAFGTVQHGILLLDMRTAKRSLQISQPPFNYQSDWPTSMIWDKHRSDMLFVGSQLGQVMQWDMRYHNRPILSLPQIPSKTPGKPARAIIKIRQVLGTEGNLPVLFCHTYNKLFNWSSIQSEWTQQSLATHKIKDFDIVEGQTTVSSSQDSITLGDRTWEIPSITRIAVNEFAKEIYAYSELEEGLICLRAP